MRGDEHFHALVVNDDPKAFSHISSNDSELNSDIRRWQDPAYVKAQAKSRLHYVMPYEVGYIVLEAGEAEAVSIQPLTSQTTSTNRAPWYRTIWQSIEQAGDTAAPLQDER